MGMTMRSEKRYSAYGAPACGLARLVLLAGLALVQCGEDVDVEPGLRRIPDLEPVQDYGARTWDNPALHDPASERMIAICEKKEPEGPQVVELKAVLAEGASPSYQGEYNYTGLMWATVRKKPELARVLLDAGADTEAINAWGRNAMFIAAWEEQDEILADLLAAGANASSCAAHDEWSALHKAAEMGNAEQVRMLLAAGANPSKRTLPDAKHPDGATPMKLTKSKAVRKLLKQKIEQIKAMLEAEGANAQAKLEDGAAPAAPPPTGLVKEEL